MTTGTISSKITKTLTLGSASYAAQLTVTNSGNVVPTASGATAITGRSGSDTLFNYGKIAGAAGKKGKNGTNGGFGVKLTAGGSIFNDGTISGGAGGNGTLRGGAGGTGVYMNGGVLTNAGAILGAHGGTGAAVNGATGAAVKFGAAAGTLVVEAGASFYGQVLGNGTNTALVLGSSASAGTLSGLGTQFTGFPHISEASGANWTLAGYNTVGVGVTVTAGGTLDVGNGTLTNDGSIAGPVTVTTGGSLLNTTQIGGTGTNGAVVSGGGVLENAAGGTIGGGTNAVYVGTGGTLVFDPGATFVGKIAGNGGGTLELASGASAGTLTGLGTSVTGLQVVTEAAGAQWYLNGASTLAVGSTLVVNGGLYTGNSLSVRGSVTVGGSLVGNVSLFSGAVLTNESGASAGGAINSNYGTIINAGTISEEIGQSFSEGFVTNLNGGVISASGDAIALFDRSAVTNYGSIKATSIGVVLEFGGNIENQAGGLIYGEYNAVGFFDGSSSIFNQGTLAGSSGYSVRAVSETLVATNAASGYVGSGIHIYGGLGTVSNYGTIHGYSTGGFSRTAVRIDNGGSLFNDGLISAYASAVRFAGGGFITNDGTILGTSGVYLKNGSLTNAGTISGSSSYAVKFGSLSGSLIIDAGAVFIGAVEGNGKNDTLVLNSSSSAGTLTGLGSQFTGFKTTSEAAGATWTLTGNNTVGSAGISLGANSTFTNTGNLSGGLVGTSSGIVATNYGTISAGAGVGVSLTLGGSFANGVYTIAGSPVINAGTGVLASGASAYVRNFGTIIANVGIDLTDGGHVITGLIHNGTFATNAVIEATSIGLEATTASAIFGNDGTVLATGSAGIGAMLSAGGKVANGFYHAPSALISGVQYGVSADGGKCIVTNYGTITGGVGVVFGANTTFGTLTNMGTITGTGGTAVELVHGADTVVLTPGAVFNGQVVGASGYDVLSLSTGTGSGTISGLGTQFTGFTAVRVNTGSDWTIQGNAIGSSTISISSSAVLDVTGALAVPSVKFLAGGHSVLELGSPSSESAVFSGFAATDTIDLQGTVATSLSFNSASHVLAVKGGGGQVFLHFSSAYTGHSFGFGGDGHGGTNITIS